MPPPLLILLRPLRHTMLLDVYFMPLSPLFADYAAAIDYFSLIISSPLPPLLPAPYYDIFAAFFILLAPCHIRYYASFIITPLLLFAADYAMLSPFSC